MPSKPDRSPHGDVCRNSQLFTLCLIEKQRPVAPSKKISNHGHLNSPHCEVILLKTIQGERHIPH